MTTTAVATCTETAVTTKQFVKELEWVARFAEKGNRIPILQTVRLTCKDGALELRATDLELTGISTVSANSDVEFTVCVNAVTLLKYAKKISDSELTIEARENYAIIHHGDGSVCKLVSDDVTTFPEPSETPTNYAKVSGLSAALPRVLVAISKEESRFTLIGALLDGSRMISTDGHRLSVCDVTIAGTLPKRVLIPQSAIVELKTLKTDSADVAVGDDFVHIQCGNRRIVARKLTGSFPDYERVMPKWDDKTFLAIVDAVSLTKHGERVALMADERSRSMVFTMTERRLMIHSSSLGKEAQSSVPAVWDGADEASVWKSGFNWELVREFLGHVPPAVAFEFRFRPYDSVKFETNAHAVEFRIPGWSYVLMPQRI